MSSSNCALTHAPAIELGVNIDHVATLRQARGTRYPDPVEAAGIAERAGADGITVHLREDRRHIQERDVRMLRETLQTRMNLEMAATDDMVAFAREIAPRYCCLVPERRAELTTEGGLDVAGNEASLRVTCTALKECGIGVSLFIDPERVQIDAAVACGAPIVELHTGEYTEASTGPARTRELARLADAARIAAAAGLQVNAGHGLDYHSVQPVAAIPEFRELNIGHAIISRAVLDGLDKAVRDMKALMLQARASVL